MQAKQKLFLNAKRDKLFPEGHAKAAVLYAAVGDQIPDEAAERFGLKDGALKGFKAADASDNKQGDTVANKGGGSAANKEGVKLTDLAGIGDATAKALIAAGIDSVAKLAELDPESAPDVAGLSPTFKWADVIAAAKAAGSEE